MRSNSKTSASNRPHQRGVNRRYSSFKETTLKGSQPSLITNEKMDEISAFNKKSQLAFIQPNLSVPSDSKPYNMSPCSTVITGVNNLYRSSSSILPNSSRPSNKLSLSKQRRNFVWKEYLLEVSSCAAPESAFSHIVNNQSLQQLEVGYRLEGIDPQHESLFCVLQVVKVVGHRIQLRFDGYSAAANFWCNSNSPFLFPVGWCDNNGVLLQPPKGIAIGTFDWPSYLSKYKLKAAPPECFVTSNLVKNKVNHKFKFNMRVEAIDRKNPAMICIATVADTLPNHILLHFDGWTNIYDQWVRPDSQLIFPVGSAKLLNQTLSLPETLSSFLVDGEFCWNKYLESVNSIAAPSECFTKQPISDIGMKEGMLLEAVDRRVPQIIRVATIEKVDEQTGMLTIHYNEWVDIYNIQCEIDSPDIYPIGYCDRLDHPLEPPPNDMYYPPYGDDGICPIKGCRGIGHAKGPQNNKHTSAATCPYSELNYMKDPGLLYERLDESGINAQINDLGGLKYPNSYFLSQRNSRREASAPVTVTASTCSHICQMGSDNTNSANSNTCSVRSVSSDVSSNFSTPPPLLPAIFPNSSSSHSSASSNAQIESYQTSAETISDVTNFNNHIIICNGINNCNIMEDSKTNTASLLPDSSLNNITPSNSISNSKKILNNCNMLKSNEKSKPPRLKRSYSSILNSSNTSVSQNKAKIEHLGKTNNPSSNNNNSKQTASFFGERRGQTESDTLRDAVPNQISFYSESSSSSSASSSHCFCDNSNHDSKTCFDDFITHSVLQPIHHQIPSQIMPIFEFYRPNNLNSILNLEKRVQSLLVEELFPREMWSNVTKDHVLNWNCEQVADFVCNIVRFSSSQSTTFPSSSASSSTSLSSASSSTLISSSTSTTSLGDNTNAKHNSINLNSNSNVNPVMNGNAVVNGNSVSDSNNNNTCLINNLTLINLKSRIIDAEIDGESILLLTTNDLMSYFNFPLGIAIKIITLLSYIKSI